MELAVLALYAQAITHPYMHIVRGPETEQVNVLDLGPLHQDVKDHVRQIIDNPDLLLSPSTMHTSGTVDGKPWQDPKVIEVVHSMMPELLHLRTILIEFLKSALDTWERFTSEFAPRGLIDLADATEHEAAWMPSTNDANEGALGSFRLNACQKPAMTLDHHNDIAIFHRNQTQDFMNTLFTEEDYTYLRWKAHEIDSSKHEAQRRVAQAAFDASMAEIRRRKEAQKLQKKKEAVEKLARTVIVTDRLRIRAMTVPFFDEQLDCLRQWDKQIPLKSHMKSKEDKYQKLMAVLERYEHRVLGDQGSIPNTCNDLPSFQVQVLDSDTMQIVGTDTFDVEMDSDVEDEY